MPVVISIGNHWLWRSLISLTWSTSCLKPKILCQRETTGWRYFSVTQFHATSISPSVFRNRACPVGFSYTHPDPLFLKTFLPTLFAWELPLLRDINPAGRGLHPHPSRIRTSLSGHEVHFLLTIPLEAGFARIAKLSTVLDWYFLHLYGQGLLDYSYFFSFYPSLI